jgi:predicted PurR-regulated permease PerM
VKPAALPSVLVEENVIRRSPVLNTYLRLVLIVAIVLVALAVLNIALHLLIPAAIIAAIVLAILVVVNFFRRRGAAPPVNR